MFCNMRESVEETCRHFAELWKPYPVVAHHGSLSRKEREVAEAVMRETTTSACVATSTLEIGVDVGNVDAVILVEVPWSISSLVQRIGRSNRRQATIEAVGIVRSHEERVTLEMMFKSLEGGLPPAEKYTADASVAVQQTLSICYGAPAGVDRSELADMLGTLCTQEQVDAVIDELVKRGYVECEDDRVYPSRTLMDNGLHGSIHSNIPDTKEYSVIDITTGRRVGRIIGALGRVFVLAGRTWQFCGLKKDTILVKPFSGLAGPAEFQRSRRKGRYYSWLPDSLKT